MPTFAANDARSNIKTGNQSRIDARKALPAPPREPNAVERRRKAALEPIVFYVGLEQIDGPVYAIGIARQTMGETPGQSSSSNNSSTSSGVAAQSKLDHCSCLLERKKPGGKWSVVRIFSVVELNVAKDDQCVIVGVDERNNQFVDVASASEAVSRALMYTLAWALPSHKEIRKVKNLSWATIIGKRASGPKPTEVRAVVEGDEATMNVDDEDAQANKARSKQDSVMPPDKYRWVTGKIFLPVKCGERFEFTATGCGNFDENDGGVSIQDAISVYFDTLLFGLLPAKKFLKLMKDPSFTLGPFPSSGTQVMIGDTKLQRMKLRGKPNKRPRRDLQEKCWSVSQGEIFTGRVNFCILKDSLEKSHLPNVFLFRDDDEDTNVVVKVASLSVHRSLNHPDKAVQAFRAIESSYGRSSRSNGGNGTSNRENKFDLFNVLFAADKMTNSLITIMADLSKDFKLLTPGPDELHFNVIWGAFLNLLQRILIPLADINVIHPDIRPGWDCTANILYSKAKKPVVMQMIDFDSLVIDREWVPPRQKGSKPDFTYIPRKSSWSCYTFLWRQCVTLAYAWYMQINQIQMKEVNILAILNEDANKFATTLGQSLCDVAKNVKLTKGQFIVSLNRLTNTLCNPRRNLAE